MHAFPFTYCAVCMCGNGRGVISWQLSESIIRERERRMHNWKGSDRQTMTQILLCMYLRTVYIMNAVPAIDLVVLTATAACYFVSHLNVHQNPDVDHICGNLALKVITRWCEWSFKQRTMSLLKFVILNHKFQFKQDLHFLNRNNFTSSKCCNILKARVFIHKL
jgi:hypothetical protein